MKILATFNIKGGVGKTATAVNLAYASATSGLRTLLWDLDPQGAASYYYRIKPKIKGGNKALLYKKSVLDNAIRGSDYDFLDILPADFSNRNFDLSLSKTGKPESQLKKLLKPLASDYDVIILDCPPSVSLLTENVLQMSHAILVPMIPTNLSLRAYKQLRKFCQSLDSSKAQLMPFYSMLDRRRKLHREVALQFAENHKNLLRVYIPYSTIVEQMGQHRAPVAAFASRSELARAYSELWQEIRTRLYSSEANT